MNTLSRRQLFRTAAGVVLGVVAGTLVKEYLPKERHIVADNVTVHPGGILHKVTIRGCAVEAFEGQGRPTVVLYCHFMGGRFDIGRQV